MIIYVSFFPFFSNIVTFFFKVRVHTISIVNARLRRRIFFRAWVAIEWRSLRTSNIRADERRVQAMSLRLSRSLVLPHRSCRYVTRQGGRASEGCERWSLRMLSSLVLPHSLRHASDVTCLLWHGTFGILWRILYFLI